MRPRKIERVEQEHYLCIDFLSIHDTQIHGDKSGSWEVTYRILFVRGKGGGDIIVITITAGTSDT